MNTYSCIHCYHYSSKPNILKAVDHALQPIRKLLNGKNVYVASRTETRQETSTESKIAILALAILNAPLYLVALIIKKVYSYQERKSIRAEIEAIEEAEITLLQHFRSKDYQKALKHKTCISSQISEQAQDLLLENIARLPAWLEAGKLFGLLHPEHAQILIQKYVNHHLLDPLRPESEISMQFSFLSAFISNALQTKDIQIRRQTFEMILQHPKFRNSYYTNLSHLAHEMKALCS